MNLTDEKAPREIGAFILHDTFNEDEDNPGIDPKAPYKDLTPIQQVFVMDHDFVCIAT